MVGVTRVLHWENSGNKTNDINKAYQEALERIEILGGKRLGRHRVNCRMLSRKKTADGYSSQRMYTVRFTEGDSIAYTVLVNQKKKSGGAIPLSPKSTGLGDECVVMECGEEGIALLDKLEIYESKLEGQFEGSEFRIGDFIVCVDMFLNKARTPKAIIMEVQYTPCNIIGKVDKLMDEFQCFLNTSTDKCQVATTIDSSLLKEMNESSDNYLKKYTSLQYIAAFNRLM